MLRVSNDPIAAEDFVFDFGRHAEVHEAIHSRQWSEHSSVTSFLIGYGFADLQGLVESGNHEHNRYERDANLYWGIDIDDGMIAAHIDRFQTGW